MAPALSSAGKLSVGSHYQCICGGSVAERLGRALKEGLWSHLFWKIHECTETQHKHLAIMNTTTEKSSQSSSVTARLIEDINLHYSLV